MTRIYNNSRFNPINRVKSKRSVNFRSPRKRSFKIGIPMQFDTFFRSFGSLNKFYFQIIGITMLTFAIILAFYSAFNLTSPDVTALNMNSENIRILTNFQKDEYSRSTNAKLVEITAPAPVATELTLVEKKDTKTAETVTKPEPSLHTVVDGDSLYSISLETGKSVESIVQMNNLVEPYILSVGQTLFLS